MDGVDRADNDGGDPWIHFTKFRRVYGSGLREWERFKGSQFRPAQCALRLWVLSRALARLHVRVPSLGTLLCFVGNRRRRTRPTLEIKRKKSSCTFEIAAEVQFCVPHLYLW